MAEVAGGAVADTVTTTATKPAHAHRDTVLKRLAEVQTELAQLKEEEAQLLVLAKRRGWLADGLIEGAGVLVGAGLEALL